MSECPDKTRHCEVALKLEEIHGEIKSQLSSGTEIMRTLKASHDAFCGRIEKILDKHDDRVNKVEKKVWWASGAASALSAIFTFLVTYVKMKGHNP